MALPTNREEREYNKFRSTAQGPAVAIVNPDGTNLSITGSATLAIGSAPTLYAVVNTQAAGQASVVLDTGSKFIGLATTVIGSAPTLYAVVNTAAAGQASIVLDAGTKFIGLATVVIGSGGGTSTVYQGGPPWTSLVTVNNQLPLVASSAFIGLATVVIGSGGGTSTVYQGGSPWTALVTVNNQPALVAGSAFIGLATVVNGAGTAYMGLASVNIGGTLPALSTGTNFIGLATVVQGNQPALVASSAFIGLATVVVGSAATIFAVVNTSAAGQASVVLDTGTKFIGLATVVIGSAPTLFAVTTGGAVNATVFQGGAPWSVGGAVSANATDTGMPVKVGGVYNSSAPVYDAGDRTELQSDVNGNLKVTLATQLAGEDIANDYLKIAGNIANAATDAGNPLKFGGLALGSAPSTASGNRTNAYFDLNGRMGVFLGGSNATIFAVVNTSAAGQASVVLDTGTKFIGLATVVVGSAATIFAVVNTSAAGQASVVLDTGTKFIGLVTVANQPALVAGSAYIGLASVNVGGTLPALSAGTAFFGLATVVIGNPSVISSISKTLNISTFAIASTNLSGATTFVSSASKKYYVTNVILSNASSVGVNFMNGVTYLTGNASIRMSLPAQGGFVETGTINSPSYFGLAAQTSFSVVTDTAAPVAGKVMWYEE